jgi:hypothetical protein
MKKMHLALIAFTFEGILMSNVNVIDWKTLKMIMIKKNRSVAIWKWNLT